MDFLKNLNNHRVLPWTAALASRDDHIACDEDGKILATAKDSVAYHKRQLEVLAKREAEETAKNETAKTNDNVDVADEPQTGKAFFATRNGDGTVKSVNKMKKNDILKELNALGVNAEDIEPLGWNELKTKLREVRAENDIADGE